MPEITITGYAYRQNTNSPLTFTFVRGVSDVVPWCGVPRKSANEQTGYQRHLDPIRKQKISQYFDNDSNTSPTSIVLGFYPESARIELYDAENEEWIVFEDDTIEIQEEIRQQAIELLEELNDDNEAVEEEDAEEEDAEEARFETSMARIVFEDPSDKTIDEIAADLLERLRQRLEEVPDEGGENAENEADAEIEEDAEEEADVEEEDDAEEEVDAENNIEFGRSHLNDLIEKLQEEGYIENNEELIRDLGLPALVIDGQHRLFGAEAIRNIPFTFVSILNADWSEQVFQFCVINKCAKPVNDDVITSNAALSLTKPELTKVEQRLSVAGFNMDKVDILNRCYLDPDAPFHEMVDMPENTLPQNRALMGRKQIDKIATIWRKGSGPFLKRMKMELADEGTPAGECTLQWQNTGNWARAFNLFWSVFAEEYNLYAGGGNEPIKGVGSQHWGLPRGESNLSKTGTLQAINKAFFNVLNETFLSGISDFGINEFANPQYEGENAWDTLDRKIKQYITGRLALRRMLENIWTITQLNTSDNQNIMVPVMIKHMKQLQQGTSWSALISFRAEGAI